MREFSWWIRAHAFGRKKARPVCSLSISSSSTSELQVVASREAAEVPGARWGKVEDSFSQAESRGLWDGYPRKSCILRSRKPCHVHAKTPSTYCVGLRERWNVHTVVDSGDTPWHFTARRTKFHWGSRRSANGWSQKVSWARKSQQRRAMWPLHEGREIWGVDGAFASISWRRHCVRDGVAPSANELAWFYRGFRHRSRRRRSRSVKRLILFIYFAFFWFNYDQICSRSCIKCIFWSHYSGNRHSLYRLDTASTFYHLSG